MLGAPCRTHTLPRQISSAMIALSQYLWHIPVRLHTTSPQQLEEVHACGRVGRGEKRGEGGERGTPSDVAGITVNVITHESDNSTKVDVKSKPNQLPLLPPGRACTKSPLPRSSLHKVSSPQVKPAQSLLPLGQACTKSPPPRTSLYEVMTWRWGQGNTD